MRLVLRVFVALIVVALCAAAAPTVNAGGIVNGASFAPVGLPNANIAQGSFFSIFGTSLGPAASPGLSFPLSRELGGVSVHVTAAGAATPINAILLYVSPTQINAVLPSAVAVGAATLTVEYPAGQVSNAVTFNVMKSSPGLLSKAYGSGPAWVQNYTSVSNEPFNSLTQSAKPGQYAILWGTGIGPVTFDETQQPQVGDLKVDDNVKVFVGGKGPITPYYAGRSSEFAGEDQVNFQLPDDVPTGCYVPVTVMANGVVSNSVSLSIVPPNATSFTCVDELVPLPSDLSKDYRQGSVSLTHMALSLGTMEANTDSATGVFEKWAAADIARLRGGFGVSTFGACTVYTIFTGSGGEAATFTPLDAGAQLNLKLPDNSTRVLQKNQLLPGYYGGSLLDPTNPLAPAVLVPGAYTVDNGSGGVDVGPFTASLTVPEILVWANMGSVMTVTRSAGQLVTWTGGDQQTPDTVIIMGSSSLADGTTGAGFYCLARASDLQFTIPPEVLGQLPPSSDQATPDGLLGLAEFSAMSKSKVTAVPTGLDSFSFGYQFMSMKTVVYQ